MSHLVRALPVLLVGAGLSCLTSCTMVEGAPPETDVVSPPAWTAPGAGAGKVHDLWWERFAQPELTALVRESLHQNRSLRSLSERIAMAEAHARIAGADLLPQVGASFSGSRQKQVFVGFPIPDSGGKPFNRTFTSYGVSLDLSWEIDLWGRIRAGQDAATADLAATVLEHEAARLSLASQVCKAWFTLGEAQAQAELARRTVESYRRTTEFVEGRWRGGVRPLLDVHLARVTLLTAEADLKQREQLLDSAKRQLELLLGRYPHAAVTAATLPPLPPPAPAGLPAEILDRRSDLRAARQRLLAAHNRVGEAKAMLYPRISLTGSTGSVGNELENLLDGDFHVWSILGNLVQPLFQGGRLRAGVDLSRAVERESLARFADHALVAFSEVEGALAAEAFLKQQTAAVEKLFTEAQETRRIGSDRYRQGRTGVLDLLAAERTAVNAESRLLAVRRQALHVRVDLHLAIGGGFGTPLKEDDER